MSERKRLTAAALIEELQKCPPDALVVIDCGLRDAYMVSCAAVQHDECDGGSTASCSIYNIDSWNDEYGDTADTDAYDD